MTYGCSYVADKAKMENASAVIIGVGCVGGLGASGLVRNGIGKIALVDYDRYEPSNLNRQHFATTQTMGMKKIEAAEIALRQIRPGCKIDTIDAKLSPENAGEILLKEGKSKYDIVMQAMDSVASRVELHRFCEQYGIPIITMSGQPPFRGMVTTFLPGCPSYEGVFSLPTKGKYGKDLEEIAKSCKLERARFAVKNGADPVWYEMYKCGNAGWGTTVGRAWMICTLQVFEMSKYLCGHDNITAPNLIYIDLNKEESISVRSPPNGLNWDYRFF